MTTRTRSLVFSMLSGILIPIADLSAQAPREGGAPPVELGTGLPSECDCRFEPMRLTA